MQEDLRASLGKALQLEEAECMTSIVVSAVRFCLNFDKLRVISKQGVVITSI